MNIYLENLNDGLERIKQKNLSVCVIGVGTIGLPLATFLASAGFSVIGLDVSESRVKEINEKRVAFEYTAQLKKTVETGKLKATTDSAQALKGVEIVFVCVPTPLDKNRAMDISKLDNATETIIKNMKPGVLLVYESSVSIGTTRTLIKKIEESTKLKAGRDFGVAYCPERYNPTLPIEKLPHVVYNSKHGEIERYTIDKVSRVVGGFDEKSSKLAKCIYSEFITTEVKEVSSLETAEATKLLENIFRDVNLALVNELATIYPAFGVNIYEVIEAAKTKPFAFLPHYPGAGVGGECIPVDTWYLIKQTEAKALNTKLLRITREVNDSMPFHIVALLEEELREKNIKFENSKISVLGLSYKGDISDTRLSPAFEIINELKRKSAVVAIYDPVVQRHDSRYKLDNFEYTFQNSDAILLVTNHSEFRELNLNEVKKLMRTPIIVDGRNFFDKTTVQALGFTYRCIGRPKT